MRIIYSTEKRQGAIIQLQRIFNALVANGHEVKVAAFDETSQLLKCIDWTLDSIYWRRTHFRVQERLEIFGKRCLSANVENAKYLRKDIVNFSPDLIISDSEPITMTLANDLGIRLWVCTGDAFIGSNKRSAVFEKTSVKDLFAKESIIAYDVLRKYNVDKKLLYSPLGDLEDAPELGLQFQWVRPYYIKQDEGKVEDNILCVCQDSDRLMNLLNLLNYSAIDFSIETVNSFGFNFSNMKGYDFSSYKDALSRCGKVIITGETDFLSDAIYNKKEICISPTATDIEQMVNADYVSSYNIGVNMHQIELMGPYAKDYLEDYLITETYNPNRLKMRNIPQLHELINAI